MKYTKEQQLAIDIRNKNILVCAGAGSGKTSVLVERIIKMISDEKNPIDIDKILAVTFTDAAALQLKQKIYMQLQMKAEQTQTKNLKRQLLLINNSNISTIHSFCANVIRKYFYIIDIDPNFRIAQENEIKLLESDVLDEMLEGEFKNKTQIFFDVAQIYNTDKLQSDNLKNLILGIYKFSRSIPNPDEWLKNCAAQFDIDTAQKIEDSIWYKNLICHIETILHQVQILIEDSISVCASEFGPEKYIEALEDDKDFICQIENEFQNDFDKTYELLARKKYKRLFSYKQTQLDQIDIEKKERVQQNRKQIKKLIDTLAEKVFFTNSQSIKNNIKNSYPIVNEIVRLTIEFGRRLSQKKFQQNILSFDDLELFTLQILENKKICVLNQIQNHFHEILIDEYQDINDVQEKILSLISKRSRFMVGDVKQSIYKFRNSSPEIFIQKYNAYTNSDGNCKIILSTNFRSSYKIIDTVNFFFSRLMTKDFGGINYKLEMLNVSEREDECEENEFYLLVNPDSQEQLILETQLICDKIKSLIKTGVCKNYSDIAILIRSRKNLPQITNIFEQNNIPLANENECDYFGLPEISTLINFLQIIDNPRNEIALVSILRSDIYCIDENELMRIRNVEPHKNFYECVEKYDGLQKFKSDLSMLRGKKNLMPLSKLINEILTATDLFYLCAINNNGDAQQQNLIKFIEIARQYEKTNYKGLFNFIRYLQKINESKINAASSKKNSDCVNLMTIHKSKGLEFPIVFVSFLGNSFNMKNLHEPILLDKNLGLGNKFVNLQKHTKISTLARNSIELELCKKNLEEEMRILYVAMTRAKSKLILTGSVKNYEAACQKNFLPQNAKCYLDWLLPIANEKDFPAKFEVIENYPQKEISPDLPNKISADIANHEISPQLKNKLEWAYPHNIFIASKISITELNQQNAKQKFVLNAPAFLKKNIISPTQLGIAIHTLLQHLDLNMKNTEHALKKFVDTMAQNNLIGESEKNIIPLNKFSNFLSSQLANKMRNAKFLYRETPFVWGIKNNPDEPETLVHGIIDCFFEYENKLYLLDYKTDKIKPGKAESFARKYQTQLQIYKAALEKNFNRSVDYSTIYLFDVNETVFM